MKRETSSKPIILDDEAEKASFAYLMSMLIVIIGIPLPIINVIGSIFFYIANRKKTYFVRFHAMQSMLLHIAVILVNSVGLFWSISVLTGHAAASNLYFSYIATAIICNIIEIVTALYAAIETRKKKDIKILFFGALSESILTKNN
ncbi:MAG: DUF4870 domain-containing protein [Dysgonamonadaceae bacterium]|jgi:uncharacterized membrane protein|nr:DUF4870 domain-containing protein [Dysgonamonadaceae bacterium]